MLTPQAGTARKLTARPHQGGQIAGQIPGQLPAHLAALAGLGTQLTVARGQEIIAEGAPGEHCFRLVSGSVRLVKLMADGRRQVCESLVAGDFIGLEAREQNYSSAEAVTQTVLMRYPRRPCESLTATTP